MITLTDIIIIMLAYAGVSLSGVCRAWHLSNSGAKPFLYELLA